MQAEVRVIMEVVVGGKVIERREINSEIPAAMMAAEHGPRRSADAGPASGIRPLGSDPPTPHLTSDPTSTSRSASVQSGWRRFVESVRGDGDLWSGFVDLTDEQICDLAGVRREVRCLDLLGVREPLSYVLEHGPERCRQVRDWVKKVKRSQGVTNEAGLVARTLAQGEPRSRKGGGGHERRRIG